jgi:RimJ/RimL family protein N-acetyltransferase
MVSETAGAGLTGERIRLRFVTRDQLPLFLRHAQRDAGGFNDFGVGQRQIPDEAWTGDELRNQQRAELFIERLEDGAILGTIQYHRVSYGPNPESAAWMLGIELTADARGQGFGTEAQRVLADWLFATTRANRIEASTDVDNVAEARSLEKAGFTREGVSRGAQFRAGAYRDLVVFSRLRSDPP